jgi:hypothetical protein
VSDKTHTERNESAFPLIATVERTWPEVSKVPLPDSCAAANIAGRALDEVTGRALTRNTQKSSQPGPYCSAEATVFEKIQVRRVNWAGAIAAVLDAIYRFS